MRYEIHLDLYKDYLLSVICLSFILFLLWCVFVVFLSYVFLRESRIYHKAVIFWVHKVHKVEFWKWAAKTQHAIYHEY